MSFKTEPTLAKAIAKLHGIMAVVISMAVLSALLCATSPLAAAEKMPAYRVETEGFGASEADIRAVLDSVGSQLWRHFDDYDPPPLVVRRGRSGPFFGWEKNEAGEHAILLDTESTYWSQYAYQFSHEFLHALCGFEHKQTQHQWFEETLAETASLYCLRAMAREWKDNPPYSNWRDYRDSLRDYADNVENSRTHLADIHRVGLPAFYQVHRTNLEKNATDRGLNGAMAVVLLRLFEVEPSHWEAVRWLNQPADKGTTFADHLALWHAAVPQEHKAFVAQVAELYGVELTK